MAPCLIGMEACVGAHFLSRQLYRLGHDARLPKCDPLSAIGRSHLGNPGLTHYQSTLHMSPDSPVRTGFHPPWLLILI
jgi:hypothetical protein